MKKVFSLKKWIILDAECGPGDWEFFCEDVDIFIEKKSTESIELFRLQIISLKWLEAQFQDSNTWSFTKYNKLPGLYFRNCLVLKYYDKEAITAHIERIVQICNKEEDSFSWLNKYFKYESL